MAIFDYTGQLRSGAAFQGSLEAESAAHADAILRDMGIRVATLRSAKRFGYVAPLSLDDLLLFNEQLAAMTRAGVPLEEGLRQLAADVNSRKLKSLLLELADQLAAGSPLETAVARVQERFPADYAGTVQAGLRSGDLGGALYGVATHLRLTLQFRRSLLELGLYPLMVFVFAAGLLSFLMRAVIPQILATIRDFWGQTPTFAALWSGQGRTNWGRMPPLSVFLAALMDFLSEWWLVVEGVAVGLLALALALWIITRPRGMRRLREAILRRIPGIARVFRASTRARFTHTAALGAFNGLPLPELLLSAGEASGSVVIADEARLIAERIRGGQPLNEAAAGQDVIPALWTTVVMTAGARGDLPAALVELARTYEGQAEQSVAVVRVIVGPVFLILIGGMIGLIVTGMVTPLVSLIQSLTN